MGETINAGLLSSLAHYFMNIFAQYRVNLHDLVTCLSHSRLQILFWLTTFYTCGMWCKM